MKRLRAVFLSAAGLLLVIFAGSQVVNEVLPAFQPTATPEEVVLEQYAPQLSLPATPTSLSPTATFPPYSTQEIEQETGAFLGLPVVGAPTLEALPNTQEQPTADVPQPTAEISQPAPTVEEPAIPTRIVIAAIDLDVPVLLAGSQKVRVGGKEYYQWTAPDEPAAGWHTSSALLGQVGNTVLSGHNNIYGAVFARLEDLNPGDMIEMYSNERVFRFVVSNKMTLPERGQPIAVRLENARWISPSEDVRLTLITCWPNKSNTHRLVIVAVPADASAVK